MARRDAGEGAQIVLARALGDLEQAGIVPAAVTVS
jgi:hypothetical protein